MGDCAGSVCGYFTRGARELPFLSFFPLSDFHLLRNLLQGRHFVFVFACGVLCFAFCLLDLYVCAYVCEFNINLQLLIHKIKGTLQFMFTCDGFMCVHITHRLS